MAEKQMYANKTMRLYKNRRYRVQYRFTQHPTKSFFEVWDCFDFGAKDEAAVDKYMADLYGRYCEWNLPYYHEIIQEESGNLKQGKLVPLDRLDFIRTPRGHKFRYGEGGVQGTGRFKQTNCI